jgi:hypothetical protein
MTTLDVSVSGPNGSIDLSNGLLGSATDVFVGACQAHREGRASGVAGAAGCDLTLKGQVLLELLSPEMRGQYEAYSSSPEDIEGFHAGIDPDADYRVGAIEV